METVAPTHPYVLSHNQSLSSCLLPCTRKKRETKIELWGLESVAFPLLSSHGRTRLDPLQCYAGAHVEPRGPRVHGGGGAHDLPHA
jgi:hypothetical protein